MSNTTEIEPTITLNEIRDVPPARVRSAHGVAQRGLVSTPESSTRDGRFGRMFRTLPALQLPEATGEAMLTALADAMATDPEEPIAREREIVTQGNPKAGDDEENAAIPSGYTYVGQFIDHDITFDPLSSLQTANDPNALRNFRTPALDLDSVYGSGPDDEPFRYERDGRFILSTNRLTGSPDPRQFDLPRASNGRAIIADPRNDENVIVSQLQATMMRFHNAVLDDLGPGDDLFGVAQQTVRWHYQWMVIHDFLRRMCGEAVIRDILPQTSYVSSVSGNPARANQVTLTSPNFRFYRPSERAYMPVEFAGAAYRFGHSMVRPFYRLNETAGPFATFSTDRDTSLTGFQPNTGSRSNWGIDWRLFFESGATFAPTPARPSRLQPSYKLDTLIVNPLINLPAAQFGAAFPSLALRNFIRGWRLGLPSGESVARAMGMTPLDSSRITLGPDNTRIGSIANEAFVGNTPLWLYVLAEAQQNMATEPSGVVRRNLGSGTLGPVGARIVAETIIGLIVADRFSYLRLEPNWRPTYGRGTTAANRVFEMRDLIAVAQQA
jgi:Animal haem peroxidase